ncbi:MAG: hypothetical protein ACJA09_001870 [Alcanivorax sp.]|jgi:hypothetical protein
MNAINMAHASSFDSFDDSKVKVRRAVQGDEPSIFTDIYLEETNIVIWRRQLSDTLKHSVDAFLKSNPTFQATMAVTPDSVLSSLSKSLGDTAQLELTENIAELADMFCCLFDLKRVGLRLTALDRAMCPKFHVDKIPCRLVTTFQGVGTEWLPHQGVNREKLGAGSNGKSDDQSGLYKIPHDIQQLNCGEVALLKGEAWIGNENAGLVHRSPALTTGEHRLLLTFDFSS